MAAFLERLHGKVEEYDERERRVRVAEQRLRDRQRELERQAAENQAEAQRLLQGTEGNMRPHRAIRSKNVSKIVPG